MTHDADFYAWLVTEEDGREGVIGALTNLGNVQLVTRVKNVADKMRPLALLHHERSGRPIRLARFTEAETLERVGE